MTKAELEHHWNEYNTCMQQALLAETRGLYRAAIESALTSWPHVDGMLQYEHKYMHRDLASVPAIDVVLKYAPLLLDFHSLNALGDLLTSQKRIEKNTSESSVERLTAARTQLWDNHRLWTHLENHSDFRQDELRRVLGGNQDYWRSLAERWEAMGLVRRTPEGGSYRLKLSTRLGEVVFGKCPSCGAVLDAPKAMFLEPTHCPACRVSVSFVILPGTAGSNVKE
jgi:hypothetical protein